MSGENTANGGGRVVVVGNNTVDWVYRVRGPTGPNGKTRAESLTIHAGGQAANVAYNLAVLGGTVEYVGAFGDDDASAFTRRSLEKAGVGLDRCVVVPGCSAHHACVTVDTSTGTRSIVMYKDDRLRLGPGVVTGDLLKNAALIYLDNHEEVASLAAIELARDRRIPIVADLEEISEYTSAIIPGVDTLIAPKDVLERLAGESDPVRMTRVIQGLGPAAVVATAGAQGAFGLDGDGEVFHMASHRCAVRDTTGAGDAFHAAYVMAMLNGHDFRSRLRFAARVAAAKCGVDGPRLTPDAAALL
ncbi:carbohydrate kinase family protein [Sinosporangium siamense]|uniref:Ribokinase n=1 Tax=Sinosporangium siamense TaxID=1367973 RepID=A0A919RDZ5_9ACTN|nr:PfkB family carbohydrate kinase [Sinosporangium siamense]GII90131.1 ribokinase [Sinosporangium siamense]